uniref:Major facilitator superfamily (MFS) profile domain-containing protein n=1 Tax=Cannabis sativa TaxID=3483 RepID=A0A803Q664_CANSA
MVGASGGLIFGYDLGISGGLTSMDSFLNQFFPSVYAKQNSMTISDDQYCKFDSQLLTLFTSSLYVASLVSSIGASKIPRLLGRRVTMLWGGILFLIGAILNASAQNIWMLILGRLFLGFGIGCANQSVPIYVSEMAPYKYRGDLNMLFQLTITIGILVANLLNYFFAKIEGGWGWRLSLGGAAVPALLIIAGSLTLPDTPNSLIERGKQDEAKDQLTKIRGVANVEEEFNDLVSASEASKKVKHPWRTLLQKKYRPQLAFAIAIPAFQQLTGMNVITLYALFYLRPLGLEAVPRSLFTTMLCHLKFGLFIFFAVFVVIMTGFIYMLLPETKGVPIDEMSIVWRKHPYWQKYYDDDDQQHRVVPPNLEMV